MVVWVLAVAAPVSAHSPHDAVDVLGVSAGADGQPIVFAMMQLTGRELLARSADGGDSWTITALPVLPRDVSRIAFSPEFAADGTVFLATTDLGVLKSTDGGNSFALLSGGGLDPAVLDLSLSPTYPSDQTLLAATATGVQRSTDGGLTWSPSGTGLIEPVVDHIEFASDAPNVVFTGRQTIHRSMDGGLTWTPLHMFEQRVAALAVSPAYSSDTRLVVALQTEGGVFTSSDAGAVWQPMVVGLSDPAVNDVALGSDGVVFAVSSGAALFRGLMGEAFALVGKGFEELSDLTNDHYTGVVLSRDYPADSTVWVGAFEGLFVSEDKGANFRQMDIYHQKFARSVAFAPDYASTGRVYLQTYGGGLFTSPAYPTVTPPGAGSAPAGSSAGTGSASPGSSLGRQQLSSPHGGPSSKGPLTPVAPWVSRSGRITALFGQRLALSPEFVDDHTMYYAQVGLWRSRDRALSWDQLPMPSGVTVIRALTLSPEFSDDDTVLLGAGQGAGCFRSEDGGATWTPLTTGLPASTLPHEFLFSPDYLSDQQVFLADRLTGFYVSNDGGDSWAPSNTGLDELVLHALAMSPDFSADQTLLAGTETMGLYKSSDGGASWSASNTGLPANLPLNVESIVFSPDFVIDRTVFMAVLAAGVFRSTDGGNTWQPVGPGLPQDAPRVVALSPDYANDGTLIVSTYNWVYRSEDGGNSFARLPGYARLDDGNPALAYELALGTDSRRGGSANDGDSGWPIAAWIVDGEPAALAIAVSRSDDVGDAVEYRFVGDTVRWYAPLAPDQGLAQVFLDGAPVELVDLYAPLVEGAEVRFERTFTGVAAHILRVENTGLANPAASGSVLRTDGFDSTY